MRFVIADTFADSLAALDGPLQSLVIALSRELAAIHPRVAYGLAPFVAKRNTPLDGQPFLGVKTADARLDKIRRGLRGKVETRPQSPRWAHVEYLVAQRGHESGHAALAAVQAGGRYRDWVRAFAEQPVSEQTVLELRWQGKEVFVVAEAVGSRKPADKELALARMRAHGIEVVSREMVAFEWMERCTAPEFRTVSRNFIR